MSKPAHRFKPGDTVWIIASDFVWNTCEHCGSRFKRGREAVVIKGAVEEVQESRDHVVYCVAAIPGTCPEYDRDSSRTFPTQAEAEAALAASTEAQKE